MNNELDNEIKVIVNGKERNIKLNEEGSLKEGEILYKENDKWYVKKINFKTIPITKEDYEKEIEELNNIIDKQDRDITTLTKDKIKLKNIINELDTMFDGDLDGFFTINEKGSCNEIIEVIQNYKNKLKELKNKGDNVEWWIDKKWLNKEVEIIEEEKKIPEKLDEIAYIDNDIALKIKVKINEIIDYLKSKGE